MLSKRDSPEHLHSVNQLQLDCLKAHNDMAGLTADANFDLLNSQEDVGRYAKSLIEKWIVKTLCTTKNLDLA